MVGAVRIGVWGNPPAELYATNSEIWDRNRGRHRGGDFRRALLGGIAQAGERYPNLSMRRGLGPEGTRSIIDGYADLVVFACFIKGRRFSSRALKKCLF